MTMRLKRFHVLTVLVLLVTGLVLAALVQPVFGTREDFSAYNPRWNGASQLAGDVYGTGEIVPAFGVSRGDDDVTLVHRSFAAMDPDPAASSILVMGPATPPTAEEAAWLRAFVEDGGRVLVADDFRAGNAFLTALGAESRFDGDVVLDLAFVNKPEFVVTSDVASHAVTRGVEETVLDHGTVLRPGADATVLAWTGGSAWLDRSGNAEKDPEEPAGPFPWLAVEPVGDGEVLVLSDPSVLVNGMREMADNAVLAERVATWLTQGDRAVLLDESHRGYADPVRFTGAVLRDLPDAWRLGLAFSALAVVLGFTVVDARRVVDAPLGTIRRVVERLLPPPAPPEKDLVSKVRERHPEWNENDLRRILGEWREGP